MSAKGPWKVFDVALKVLKKSLNFILPKGMNSDRAKLHFFQKQELLLMLRNGQLATKPPSWENEYTVTPSSARVNEYTVTSSVRLMAWCELSLQPSHLL